MGSHTSPNAQSAPNPRAQKTGSFLLGSLNRFAVVVAFFPALALGFSAIAGGASAQSWNETAKVAYGDLNLSSPAGAKALLHRIEAAADKACAPALLYSPLAPRAEAAFETCRAGAVSTAVTSFNSPNLALLWQDEAVESGLAIAAR